MKITLTYFKPHGKYYSGGTMDFSDDVMPWSVISAVRSKLRIRMLPGLVAGHSYYHVLVTGDDNFVPALVMEPDLDE